MSDDKVIPLFDDVTMQLRSCEKVIERLEGAVAAQETTDDPVSARFNRLEREAAEVARSLRQAIKVTHSLHSEIAGESSSDPVARFYELDAELDVLLRRRWPALYE